MRALFRHKETNRLKVTRITFVLFLIMLVAFSVVYKMSKSVNQVLVSIEHVFAPQDSSEPEAAAQPEAVEKAIPEQIVKKKENKAPEEKVKEPELKKQLAKASKDPEQSKESANEKVKEEEKTPKRIEQALAKTDPLGEVESKTESVKTILPAAKPSTLAEAEPEITQPDVKEPIFNKALENLAKAAPPAEPAKVQLVSEKMKIFIEQIEQDKPKKIKRNEQVTLESKAYFDVYNEWQTAGDTLDKEKELVALRIVNLENVYNLFQMKVVAVKNSLPHIDLADNSRVSNPSLSEFSTTCFVVSKPWEKWGDALKISGLDKNDDIQVRYYTYDFVRNSIYARAMKAFEWSLKQKNLPGDTDPGTADVLGVVYAVKKDSGGSFGVFVPTTVDFASHGSVTIDPLLCFSGQKDIEALNNAGLL